MMFLVCAAIFCQLITFNDTDLGWAECTGTEQQLFDFYETWKHAADPQCDGKNLDWWEEYDHNIKDHCNGRIMYYANTTQTRSALFSAVIKRGCSVRFKVTIAPFGSFYVWYNPWVHWSLTGVILFCLGLWIRRGIVRRTRTARIA